MSQIGPQRPPPRPIQGPSLPPAVPSTLHNENDISLGHAEEERGPHIGDDDVDSSDDSSDDSDFGPALASTYPDGPNAATTAANDSDDELPPDAPPPITTRDDWMLRPPSGGGLDWSAGAAAVAAGADPAKYLRARTFASGRAAAVSAAAPTKNTDPGHLWTETLAEKKQRLADSVLGRATTNAPTGGSNLNRQTAPSPSAAAVTTRDAQIRAYTEAARGPSLYETHQASLQGRGTGHAKDGKERRGLQGGDRDQDRDRARYRDRDRGRDRDNDTRSQSHRHKYDRNHEDRHHSHRERDHDQEHDRDRHHDRRDHDHGHKRREHRRRSASPLPPSPPPPPPSQDNPSARPFDREKDMGLATTLSHQQRRDLVRRAADLGGRFSKGSFL